MVYGAEVQSSSGSGNAILIAKPREDIMWLVDGADALACGQLQPSDDASGVRIDASARRLDGASDGPWHLDVNGTGHLLVRGKAGGWVATMRFREMTLEQLKAGTEFVVHAWEDTGACWSTSAADPAVAVALHGGRIRRPRYITPDCLSDRNNPGAPMMMWSSMGMPSNSPDVTSRWVSVRSCRDGSGSPEG